jgi:hypothetical protein
VRCNGRDEENSAAGGFFCRWRVIRLGKGFVVAYDHAVGAGLSDKGGAGEINGEGLTEVLVGRAEEGFIGDDAGGVEIDVNGAISPFDLGYRLADLVA